MTSGQKGHRCGGRRRREESLISPHLRFTIPDLRSPTHYRVNCKSYIVNFWHLCLCHSAANGGPWADGAAIASRLAASKPAGEDGSGRNQTDQTKIKPNLTLFKPKKWQRHLHSIKKSASLCGICGSNPVFKIKKPSPNTKKLLKVNKGQLRLYDTPGGPLFYSPLMHRPGNAKSFIFNHFIHVPTVQFRSFLTPKMMQFMSVFQACKLLNKCQKMPILITSSLHHFITSTLHHFDASTTSHSTLFVGIFAQKIRNFFTRPLLEISAKSGK